MAEERFLDTSRTEKVIGAEGVACLSRAHVCVFGIGGVGGHLSEALARAGVGALTLVDGDCVSPSNVNRQIIALQSTVGRPKTDVMRDRIADINPACKVTALPLFFDAETAESIDFSQFDCVADCIDSVASKVELICRAQAAGVPVISSMGAGNKLHPEQFRISDIYKTAGDPLAKTMRHALRARGIASLPCVWSDEQPLVRCVPPGSMAFVPGAAGLVMAGWIVRKILRKR